MEYKSKNEWTAARGINIVESVEGKKRCNRICKSCNRIHILWDCFVKSEKAKLNNILSGDSPYMVKL